MGRKKELEELILKHKALYYGGKPEIDDEEYDALEEELRRIDKDNRVLSLVGQAPRDGRKIPHATKMLSLSKVYTLEELEKWRANREVVSTHKLDGISCSLIYEEGLLVLAKTRGDSRIGEEITEKVRWLSSIPATLPRKAQGEIRGELFCTGKNFKNLSEEMVLLGLAKPSNQRNIVAGLVSRKDHLPLCRYLHFKAFDFLGREDFKTEIEKFRHLKKLSFDLPEWEHHEELPSIEKTISKIETTMATGDYLIDGLVFTFNRTALQREMGQTSHHPRYKMAFKHRKETKSTILRNIVWQVSRNGILTPIGIVEPVLLSGARVERVSLHNVGLILEHKLKKGDTISLTRSGEVIPKFVAVLKKAKGRKVSIPSQCPSCRASLVRDRVRLYCPNPSCKEQIKMGILYFISRIGIDSLSDKRLERLMEKKLVTTIPDLYKLTVDDILSLENTKETLAQKLHGQIQSSKKSKPLALLLEALGLAGLGPGRCEALVEAGFNTVDKILDLTLENLLTIEGFAEKSATAFLDSLEQKKPLLQEILHLGFSFEREKKSGLLAGKKVCITGKLKEKRATVERNLRQRGATIVGSVSRGTDILVRGESVGISSKLKKAQQWRVSIVGEEELKKMMG